MNKDRPKDSTKHEDNNKHEETMKKSSYRVMHDYMYKNNGYSVI